MLKHKYDEPFNPDSVYNNTAGDMIKSVREGSLNGALSVKVKGKYQYIDHTKLNDATLLWILRELDRRTMLANLRESARQDIIRVAEYNGALK